MWPRRLWHTLGSSRLTAILMAALLMASLFAALFPQMPADPAAQTPWLSAVTLRYGGATTVMHALGFFDAYHSAWYRVLLAALLLNMIACTLKRMPRLWLYLTRRRRVVRHEAFYRDFAHRFEWNAGSLDDGLSAVKETLHRRRYRLYVEREDGSGRAYVYAEKGRWAEVGTLFSHVSAVILIFAVTARPALSWQIAGIPLLPGQAHTLDISPPVTVRAGPLQIERHPDGRPRDYQVSLAVTDGSSPITRTVQINEPLTYRGVAFHLQGYGPAATVVTPEGIYTVEFSSGQTQEIALPEADLRLRLAPQPAEETIFVEAMNAEGASLGAGIVADGQQVSLGAKTITFELSRYTVWMASSDPTFPLALGAAALMLLGMLISLWTPQRRLWLQVAEGNGHMVGGSEFEGDFEPLASEIARRLGHRQASQESETNG